MGKAVIGIIPILVIAVVIALWVSYNTKLDELISANERIKVLEQNEASLKLTVDNSKTELSKMIIQLQQTQQMLENRENKLQELQVNVYKQFKSLENLGQNNSVVRDYLLHNVPDGLWDAVFGQSQCSGTNTDSKAESARSIAPAISGTGS